MVSSSVPYPPAATLPGGRGLRHPLGACGPATGGRWAVVTARTGGQAVAVAVGPVHELLSWDEPVALAGESRPPAAHERGFVLRLHGDAACPSRLAPHVVLRTRRYDEVRADDLCADCTTALVAAASSSVVRRLRDAERTLHHIRASASDRPVPREVVHCRALRHEAEQATGVHPLVPVLAQEVVDLATEVAEALRDALRRTLSPRRA